MKKLLAFLIPVCIISFICFGVTAVLFGKNDNYYHTSNVVSSRNYFVDELIDSNSSWEIANNYSDINLHSVGVTTIVNQNDGDLIQINAKTSGKEVHISCYEDNQNELTIEIRPENVSFDSMQDAFKTIFWNEYIFSSINDVVVTVSLPQTIYNRFNLMQGSGHVSIKELYAKYDSFNVGSGTLEVDRVIDYSSENLNMELGSGKVKINNYKPNNYSIDIASGSCEVAGLCGQGSVSLMSGKASIGTVDEFGTCEIDVASGKLDLYIPQSGAVINADVLSGKVDIDAYGVSEKLNEFENSVTVGNGASAMQIDLASGKVSVYESENAPEIDFSITYDSTDSTSESKIIDYSTEPASSTTLTPLDSEDSE